MKSRNIFLAATLGAMSSAVAFSQNIAVNSTGAAAAATNMFEVTQTSTAANMVAMYAIHSGATAGTGYGLYATKTGASTTNIAGYFNASGGTNNYAIIVPSAGGNVGIGNLSPLERLTVNGSNRMVINAEGTQTVTDGVTQVGIISTTGFAPVSNTPSAVGIGSWNTFAPPAGVTITNAAMFASSSGIQAGAGTVTNGYGLFISAPNFGTNRYSAYFESNVGIGIAAPAARLDVVYAGTTNTYASKILHSGNASNPGTGLIVSNGYPASSASGSYEIFGTYGNSFGTNYVSVRDNGNVGIGTTNPGTVPGWTTLANMRALEVSGDGSAGTFTDGVLLLSNNRAAATVGDQVGALCFAHRNNAGNFPAVICSYLTGAGGANGFGAKLEFHTKANNVLGHLLRMVITQDGNIGIGTASPSAHVEIIDATSGANSLTVSKDFTGIGNTNSAFIGGTDFAYANTGIYVNQKDALGFPSATSYIFNVVNNGSSSFVVNGLGGVGIGTLSPAEKLTIRVAADQNLGLTSVAGIPMLLAHNNAWNAWLDLSINNSLLVQAGGNVGIGNTNPGYKLHVSGDIYATGQMYCFGVGICSDLRFKKDIEPIGGSLDKILKLNGVYYNWNRKLFPEKGFSEEKQIGFIAQNIEMYFPELVSKDKDGYRAVDYARLTPVLVEAIKEQQKSIEQLKNDKALSDARIEKLEAIVRILAETSQR